MLTASISTIIIVVAMACIFLRYNRRAFSLAILPLTVTPLFYSLSVFLSGYFHNAEMLLKQITACALLVSVVIAGILFGLCTLLFASKKANTSYLSLCGGFTLVFALVLLLNTI